jgi:hypothetical protein
MIAAVLWPRVLIAYSAISRSSSSASGKLENTVGPPFLISGVIAPTAIIGVLLSRESANWGRITPVMVEMTAGTFSISTMRLNSATPSFGWFLLSPSTSLIGRPLMPPAALISSSARTAPRLKSAP